MADKARRNGTGEYSQNRNRQQEKATVKREAHTKIVRSPTMLARPKRRTELAEGGIWVPISRDECISGRWKKLWAPMTFTQLCVPKMGSTNTVKRTVASREPRFPVHTGRSSTQPCRAPAWEYDIRNNKRAGT
jgi:hypothetical protein